MWAATFFDYGRAVFAAGDGQVCSAQSSQVVQPRLRFAPNAANMAELALLVAGGTILSVTAVAQHRRNPITVADTAPVPVRATAERPSNTNLTTLWDISLASQVFVTQQGPEMLTEPGGGLWTPDLLQATEFSLEMQAVPSGHPYINQYFVDWYYLLVTYATACLPFPTPAGGGQACTDTTTPVTVPAGYGYQA